MSLRPLRPHQTAALDGLKASLMAGQEVWLPVVGYEGIYEVSDLGRVKSCARYIESVDRSGSLVKRYWSERFLKPTTDKGRFAYGRLQVKLCGYGKQLTRLVHHLVAEAFIGSRPEGYEVAHCDGDASNNRVSNLRYATPRENTADKYAHGTVIFGERTATAKLMESDVLQIKRQRGVRTVQSLANEFGVSIAQISRIQSGRRWGHVHE